MARLGEDSTGELGPTSDNARAQEAISVPNEQECTVCSVHVPVERLIGLQACAHPAQICGECTANWIQEQVASNSWDRIRCPADGCNVVISHNEIKEYATTDVFNR